MKLLEREKYDCAANLHSAVDFVTQGRAATHQLLFGATLELGHLPKSNMRAIHSNFFPRSNYSNRLRFLGSKSRSLAE